MIRLTTVLILLGLCLCGACTSAPITSNKSISHAQDTASQQSDTLTKLGTTVGGMTPGNIDQQKPLAVSLAQDAKSQNTSIRNDLGVIAKEDAKQVEQIKTLQKSDPVKEWLQLVGVLSLGAGVLSLLVGIFFAEKIPFSKWLRSGGATAVVFGICLLSIARWLGAFEWLAIVAVVGSVGIWILLHRKDFIPYFRSLEETIKVEVSNVSKKV